MLEGPALAPAVEVLGRQNGPRDKRFFIESRVLAEHDSHSRGACTRACRSRPFR